jgi:hypothetical protein
MKQIYPDLWRTAPEHPLPDELPDLMMHAYLLVREQGNLLFCRAEHPGDHRQIRDLGGITHQYLTHWHEAAPGLARIKETFGSKLVCHRLAEQTVRQFSPVDLPSRGARFTWAISRSYPRPATRPEARASSSNRSTEGLICSQATPSSLAEAHGKLWSGRTGARPT